MWSLSPETPLELFLSDEDGEERAHACMGVLWGVRATPTLASWAFVASWLAALSGASVRLVVPRAWDPNRSEDCGTSK